MTADEIDKVVAEFRVWLEEVATTVEPESEGTGEGQSAPDLHTLLSELIALRHEVHLQTRATRNQQQQYAEALQALNQGHEEVRRSGGRAANAQKPDDGEDEFLKTLIEIADALSLAQREMRRHQAGVRAEFGGPVDGAAQAGEIRRGLWSRLFGRAPAAVGELGPEGANVSIRRALDSMVTGYGMSLERVERALVRRGLEPIDCAGRRFDPAQMEAVEVVHTNDRPAGEVVEEIRRGYFRDGRVFRHALVKVAKPAGD